VVRAEYSYDGSRLTFLISGTDDGSGRLETRSLRDDMQQQYAAQQVALRQIGPRDVAKLLGGMGACGLETRCCSMFLTEFSPISIKMAKEQGLSLNPEEITGMCGRLRCCLVYEYEQYVAARKTLPRRGKLVTTARGPGKVIDVNPLKESVFVAVQEGDTMRVIEFMKDDLQPLEELEALKSKANSPCDRHESGGCNCGKAKKHDKGDS
jgi:cell fate regulator YaaT (PSP1 superfamily)